MKEAIVKDFLAFLLIVLPSDIQVFSNRLKSEVTDGSTSNGFVIY
jgi:hypothetical protein